MSRIIYSFSDLNHSDKEDREKDHHVIHHHINNFFCVTKTIIFFI